MKPTVVITGVGKGFGKQLLSHLSRCYHVIGLTRSAVDIDQLRSDSNIDKNNIDLHDIDVSKYDDVRLLMESYLSNDFYQIFGLINNAGVRSRMKFLDTTISDFELVSSTNLFAPIHLVRLILPYMVARQYGRIINISSILSTTALPELSAYSVSKAGMDGFTRSIATEFGEFGVTCNSILPGFCETSYFEGFKAKTDLYQMTLSRTPARRWGKDSELIGLCDLLLGPQGGYINGASIPVDGGWTAC